MKKGFGKRLLAIGLSAAMLLGTVPFVGAAEESNGIQYNVSRGEVEITGYNGVIDKLVIPQEIDGHPVTSIKDKAFKGRTDLQEVVIPDSIIEIGFIGDRYADMGAFAQCVNLRTVKLGNSVQCIGTRSFAGCTNLREIKIPESVTELGDAAFSDCKSLKEITIPKSVKTIPWWAFANCTNLTDLTIEYGVKEIMYAAFLDCTNLSEVVIPDSVVGMHNAVFGRSGVNKLKFSKNCNTINMYTCQWCDELEEILIPNGVTRIAYMTFQGCESLKTLWIPRSMVKIEGLAFDRTGLTEVYYAGSEQEWNSVDCAANAFPSNVKIHFNSEYNMINEGIVEQVSLYTSDGGETYKRVLEKLLNKLKDESISQDLRSQILNEFYTLSGITDIDEAIAWCNDASNAKRAYDFLTNDEVYLAYQYANYLNNTFQGNFARGLLLSSGWIFNGDLLQYVDPSTYIAKETHSIKNYKTMLLDFMEYDSMATELATTQKVMMATLKDVGAAVDISGEIRDELYEEKFTQLSKSTTIEEAQEIFKESYGEITKTPSGGGKSIVFKADLELIADSIGTTSGVMNIAANGVSDILAMVQLESKMETVSRYSEFLKEITEGTEFLPYGLIVAAQQLLVEMQTGYADLLEAVASQMADSLTNDVFDLDKFLYTKLDKAISAKFPSWGLGDASVASAIGVIELGAWCVDQITGIGELVKQSAYVEAYAMLGMYYSTLLAQCKTAFLADKAVENAWDFYDHYQLLFAIRSKGENAYLAMCKTQGIINILLDLGWNAFGIQDREAYVEKTFKYMNEHCVFALENADVVENGHRYPQKAVIQCPVNIEVYDQTGNLVYTLYDGKPIDETNDIGRFICSYRPSTGEYVKAIYLNDTSSYQLRIIGTDTGNVDISTAVELDGNLKTAQKTEIPITKDGTIILNTVSNDYSVDSDGDGTVEDSGNLTEVDSDNYIAVTGIQLGCSELEMKIGEKGTLGAVILPANVTFNAIQWTSSDSSVASVNGNGAVTANSAGTAVITATTADGGYTATCTVTVLPRPADYTSLDELIDQADVTLNSNEIDNYTKDSVAALESALEQAKAVDRNLTSEQQEIIDAAARQLQTALDGLVRYTKLNSVTIVPTNSADEKSGELIYHKTPWYKTWTSQTVELGVRVNEGAEIKSVRWQAANWSVDEPEAVFEGATDQLTAIVRPTFGVGPRSFWVQAVVEDYNGNIVVSDPVKVRFYNWNWQK